MNKTIIAILLCSLISCDSKKRRGSFNENENLELRQEELSKGINDYINFYINDFDTMTYIGLHHTEGGVLQESNYIWHKNLVFKSKELIEKGENGMTGYRRFAIKSFQYNNPTDCEKAYNSWISLHNINNGKITFKEEPETFTPEPTLVITTKDQLIMLMGYCYVDSTFWNETKRFLLSHINGIKTTSEFGCDSNYVLKKY